MAYAVRTVVCTTCHKPMRGRYKPNPPWSCVNCALLAMSINMVSMHEKTSPLYPKAVEAGRTAGRQIRERSGPVYEKWRRGMRAYAARIADL